MEIDIQKNILEANDNQADINRKYFKDSNVFVLNMMSSPGSGKTQTLCETFKKLIPDIKTGVIVGDICTDNDAKRLETTGVKATQINTDKYLFLTG